MRSNFQTILDTYLDIRQNRPFGKCEEVWGPFGEIESAIESTGVVSSSPTLDTKWSAGLGNWAKVPWISILDERETDSTRSGIYVSYLFREDMSGVYLALELGTHSAGDRVGSRKAAASLEQLGDNIWSQLPELEQRGFRRKPAIDLRTETKRGLAYESATVGYKYYPADELPSDEELKSDLRSLLTIYQDFVSERVSETEQIEDEAEANTKALSDVVGDFGDKLTAGNIDFGVAHQRTVRTFVTSLATSGFVILTGVSGSGKTQIAKQFGNWLGEDRYKVVPVRPDWTGSEAIFGYEDALLPPNQGRRAWHVPTTLEFMLRARDNPDEPFLLVLDEMNLAHVERYFADALSGMESGEPCLPNLRKEADGHYRIPADSPRKTSFPDNLFIAGTVNVDETTYMFSPKVLDRANTIEFRVATEDLRTSFAPPKDCATGGDAVRQRFLEAATDKSFHIKNPNSSQAAVAKAFRNLHRILEGTGFEFAHRTFQEVVRFAALHEDAGTQEISVTLDVQILQKVLPRLHGSRRKLEPVLERLANFAFRLPDSVDELMDSGETFSPLKRTPASAELPNTFEKIQRMMKNLRANQFASFTE